MILKKIERNIWFIIKMLLIGIITLFGIDFQLKPRPQNQWIGFRA